MRAIPISAIAPFSPFIRHIGKGRFYGAVFALLATIVAEPGEDSL
jgi:hypothetical protein